MLIAITIFLLGCGGGGGNDDTEPLPEELTTCVHPQMQHDYGIHDAVIRAIDTWNFLVDARLSDDAVPPGRLDLQGTLTHEYGHALGIDTHSDNPDTIMYHTRHYGETRRYLTEEDIELLPTNTPELVYVGVAMQCDVLVRWSQELQGTALYKDDVIFLNETLRWAL